MQKTIKSNVEELEEIPFEKIRVDSYSILPQDKEWNNFYVIQPSQGQHCTIKKKGSDAYVGHCVFNDGYFETYQDKGNRFVITRWKSYNLWLPLLNL